MAYRWDPQPLPPTLNPDIASITGKYAAKLLALRGILSAPTALSFLVPERYTPTSAFELPDMKAAVDRILNARESQEKVLIWGDFDCDGVTSTSLLLSAFRPLGIQVDFTIPLRSEEGHGLNPERLQWAIQTYAPQLIITVDCGVANHTEIAQAQAQGVDVIVTDHHLLPDPLPTATAVVNPLRLPLDHPLRFLPGVGVAYKLAEAVYTTLEEPNVEKYLDLAVVGVVADVAVLQRECRYLVQKGLPILAMSCHQGLKQLIDRQVGDRPVSAEDVGFRIAPKLNAIGRLDDATLAVELLTTEDPERATELIDQFIATNEERKVLTEQVVSDASQQIEGMDLTQDRAIVLASPEWSQGVVGIAASRLVETYGCPTVLIACRQDKGEGYGSGRSIPAVNIVDALNDVAPLLDGYGGHPMAAGLRVAMTSVDALRAALTRALSERVSLDMMERELPIEIILDLNLTQDPVAELDEIFCQITQLEPFGHGNPRPIIALLHFEPKGNMTLSRNGQHLSFMVGSHRLWYWRHGSDLSHLNQMPHIDIAFTLETSTLGNQSWQGNVRDVRPSGDWHLHRPPAIALQVQDYRRSDKLPAISTVYDGHIPEPNRELLLVLWPYLPDEFRDLLQHVQPQTLYLGAKPADFTAIQEGLVHFVNQWDQGIRDLDQLAAGGIPLPLVTKAFVASDLDQSVLQQLIDIIQESQAFHRWLDQSSDTEILKLCKRLLQPVPTIDLEQSTNSATA